MKGAHLVMSALLKGNVMAEPRRIQTLGNGFKILMSDNTVRVAHQTQGDLWLVKEPPPPVDPDPPTPTTRFIWPFPLSLVTPGTGEFGQRWGRLHAGIDFGYGAANVSGTAIIASSSGTVIVANKTNSHGGYGNAVVIDHGNGLHTLYGHMRFLPNGQADVSVNVGQKVAQGQRLGGVGKTGASQGVHLHFETHEGGYRWNASARNPRDFIPKWNKA